MTRAMVDYESRPHPTSCRHAVIAWHMFMTRSLVLVGMMLMSTITFADADDGEYLGYKLGEKFIAPRHTAGEPHITGARIYIVEPGRQPHHIDSMSVYVSPKSLIIGSIFGEWYFSSTGSAKIFADHYLASLTNKYSHWKLSGRSLTHGDYQLWVEVEEKPPIAEHWPSHQNTRVAIGLIFAPDSAGRIEWMALIEREISSLALARKH